MNNGNLCDNQILNTNIQFYIIFIGSTLYLLLNSQWLKLYFPNYKHIFFAISLIALLLGLYYDKL